MNKTEQRPLYQIAQDIRKDWQKVYFGAVPYLEALESLNKITDMYICETGKSMVLYFLANATTWKGETARTIKAVLKAMCK